MAQSTKRLLWERDGKKKKTNKKRLKRRERRIHDKGETGLTKGVVPLISIIR